MLIDLAKTPDAEINPAETLIVGAGAIGLAIGVALARSRHRTVILEAGGLYVEPQSQALVSAAQNHGRLLRGLHQGRFRALGGSTNFWGGQLGTFDDSVFGARPWISDGEWPLTRADLAPFYEQAYQLLGVPRHLSNDEIWQALKLAPPGFAETIELLFTAWSPQPNFAQAFDDEIRHSPWLQIFVHAPVTSLAFDESGKRMTGASVRRPNGKKHDCSASHFILANGTIEIARLLQMPLQDGRAAPWKQNPWLGRGFIDHLDCLAGMVKPLDAKRFHDLFDNAVIGGIKYMPKLRLAPRLQKEKQLVDIGAYFSFRSNLDEHLTNAKILAKAFFRGRTDSIKLSQIRQFAAALPVLAPLLIRYLRHRRIGNCTGHGIELRLMSEQIPRVESHISILEKTDELGMPIAAVDWKIDGRELETMRFFAETIAEDFNSKSLASITLEPFLRDGDARFIDGLEDMNHHMGGARMSNSPKTGVVDADLRVHGTENLHVASMAVFPTTGFGSPTLTGIALGLRLATHLHPTKAG
jgi:choline dehydrogenase-like flavoprotein